MDNTKEHQELVDNILFAIGSLPNFRVWPRQVGTGRALNNYKHVISYGIPGEADIQGIIKPHGKFLAIEVKTGKGKLSVKQKKWKDMILKYGGVHIEARSVDQVLTELKKYL